MDELPERDVGGIVDLSLILCSGDTLYWDNAVRMSRQHGPGHNFHALPGICDTQCGGAGALGPGNLECSRTGLPITIGERDAVHRDSVEGWLVPLGAYRLVEHGVNGVGKRQSPRPERRHALNYQAFRVSDPGPGLSIARRR